MYELFTFFDLDQIDSNTLAQCISYLPADRKSRIMRYRHEIDQKMSVVSYMMLLHALYQCYGLRVPRITCTQTGKPYLVDYPDIHFNISHCPRGCICGISDSPIGVDIQDVRPFSIEIAKMCCTNNELSLLSTADDPAREFTKMWAMKECYLKMTGEGISHTLPSIDTSKLDRRIHTFKHNGCYVAVSASKRFKGETE